MPPSPEPEPPESEPPGSRTSEFEPPASVPPPPPPASGPSCLSCATVAGSAGSMALTWVRERDERGRDRWLCPACARRHVRDIEAKLAPEWW